MIQTEVRPVEAPAVPKVKTVGNVLRHAALIIEERGWYQGYYSRGLDIHGDDRGPVCALGAINVAAAGTASPKGLDTDDRYTRPLERIIGRAGVGFWNDDRDRTASDVIAALRAAAEEADRG